MAPWIMFPACAIWEPLYPLGTAKSWKKGALIYTIGDAADSIIFMVDGFIKIGAVALHGSMRGIGIFGPGSILGQVSLFCEFRHEHPLRCISDSSGYLFSKEVVFEHILPKHPVLVRYMLKTMAHTSYMMSRQLECASFFSSEQVLANFLYHLSLEQQSNSWIYLKLSRFSVTALADLLGMHRVTATKIFNRFKQEELLCLTGGRIRVLNSGGLLSLLTTTRAA